MFLGHALLAFALAALVAEWRGWPARRALTLGVVAGAFAAIPDVDVVYAALSLDFGGLTVDAATRPSTFWDATRGGHRTMTHSLVVALIAGPAFGLWAVREAGTPSTRGAGRGVAAMVLAGLVAVAYGVSGPPGALVLGLFAVAGVAVASLCRLRTDLRGRIVALAATGALLSHPWGDLVTGDPPRLLYPLDVRFLDGRMLLHSDPTLHLLGAFALELGVIWLAALTTVRLLDWSWRGMIDPRALTGLGYGLAALLVTPPTLDVSYHFVFSVVSVGLVCGAVAFRSGWTPERPLANAGVLESDGGQLPHRLPGVEQWSIVPPVVLTGLTGATTALVGYGIVYGFLAVP